MAKILELPDSARENLAGQISEQLRRNEKIGMFGDDAGGSLDEEKEKPPLVEVGQEYFEVYSLEVLDPTRLKEAGGDLTTFVTLAHSLHHPVTFAGGGKGFALTNVVEGEEWGPLSGFFESSIASNIDRAVELAQNNKDISNTANARLLLAPVHQVTALWFCKDDDCTGETQLLIVSAPDSDTVSSAVNQTQLRFGQVISSADFLRALAASGPTSGFNPTERISRSSK